ncbi:hypothetical protein F5984_25955 [Rudanella paleaurantiibacter]|uniref:Helix-turn-helix domain-containing protein n=1 Tax=Rudanella paleaurantiibacter TaxID=2614655 RepID=A0A7J5TRT7_9BACT|nr:hypothetical protein [Rudanella paleaurantiibacter]KAB7725490.1 hypothetical protein F5984_25955 [Rudanella paleaurantiibacter]
MQNKKNKAFESLADYFPQGETDSKPVLKGIKHLSKLSNSETIKDILSARLLHFRTMLNKSQYEIAQELNISQNVIFRSENKLSISLTMLLNLLFFYRMKYNLNISWLFAEDPDLFTIENSDPHQANINHNKLKTITAKFIREAEELVS